MKTRILTFIILLVLSIFALVTWHVMTASAAASGTGFGREIVVGQRVSYIWYLNGEVAGAGRVELRACIGGAGNLRMYQNWFDGEGWFYQDQVYYGGQGHIDETPNIPYLVWESLCHLGVFSDTPGMLKSLMTEVYLPINAQPPMRGERGEGDGLNSYPPPYP